MENQSNRMKQATCESSTLRNFLHLSVLMIYHLHFPKKTMAYWQSYFCHEKALALSCKLNGNFSNHQRSSPCNEKWVVNDHSWDPPSFTLFYKGGGGGGVEFSIFSQNGRFRFFAIRRLILSSIIFLSF